MVCKGGISSAIVGQLITEHGGNRGERGRRGVRRKGRRGSKEKVMTKKGSEKFEERVRIVQGEGGESKKRG